jgi:serine/threonine-protein kinase
MINNINGYTTKDEWFIGKGGFGSVYKAEKDGHFFAIKIIQSENLKTELDKKRLDNEIKALQKIDHPNVVKYHEHGTFTDKGFEYFYIVMDFIEGRTLRSLIGLIDENFLTEITNKILDTIDHIHKQGVFHRDLKPDNIILNHKNEPIILDFGLSKLIDYTSITPAGSILGTYAYMSPEQIRDSKEVDERSDYFSVGIIMYHLLTGQIPYTATNLGELIRQITDVYPTPPSEINPSISNRIEDVILVLIEKESHRRYQNIDAIKSALNQTYTETSKLLGLDTRHFYRLIHTDKTIGLQAISDGLIDNIIFPANLFKQYHKTVNAFSGSGIRFITDPSTNRLPYTVFSQTAGLKDLPYASQDETTPVQPKDFYSITQIKDYVKLVIDYQIQNKTTELVAPFFYTKHPDDTWATINIQLLKESIAYRNETYPKIPLWGGICFNVEHLYEDDIKNKILNRYVRVAPDGFLVYGDPVGNSSNLVQLTHYSKFLLELQNATAVPVVACRMNAFGLVLLAIGISGISSGISGLDSFSEATLSESKDGHSGDSRYYIPELLSMVTLGKKVTTKLKDLSSSSIADKLICACKNCKNFTNGETMSLTTSKMHFLERRKEEINILKGLSVQERIDYMNQRIDDAIKNHKILVSEGIKVVNSYSHLEVWKKVLAQFSKKDTSQ